MPRSQSSAAAHQRQSPRVPLRLKPAAASEANSLTGAAAVRTVILEKKRLSRVSHLETKLGETMVELKLLKVQLELEAAAKTAVLKKLEKTKKVAAVSRSETVEKPLPVEKGGDSCITTDICEVAASETITEMAEMRAMLAEKEKELETVKKEAEQSMANSSAERNKNREMETKLGGAEEELRQSRAMLEQLKQRMECQEGEKEAMEAEMKRLRIQTDQWRKASEAAASILDNESFRTERKTLDTYGDGLPAVIAGAEVDEALPGQKRRGGGGGMRVFGELWKKRGQQK